MLEDISTDLLWCLNESPSEKEGKFDIHIVFDENMKASMKVPPKRKGNVSRHL